YVTVSAAMSNQQEAAAGGDSVHIAIDNDLNKLPDGPVEFTTPPGGVPGYYRRIRVNGQDVFVPSRAVVLVFDSSNYDKPQTILVRAADDSLAEGDRTVTVSHGTATSVRAFSGIATFTDNGVDPDTVTRSDRGSFVTDGFAAGQLFRVSGSGVNDGVYVIQSVAATTITINPTPPDSAFPVGKQFTTQTDRVDLAYLFDQVAVRNVEVTVRDNDQPGVIVRELDGSTLAAPEDGETIVLEGSSTTRVSDYISVELATAPTSGRVYVRLDIDPAQLQVSSASLRFDATTRTVWVDKDNWNKPVLIQVDAVQESGNGVPDDEQVSVVTFRRDAATTAPGYAFDDFRLDVDVFDDDTAGVLLKESEGNTVVLADGSNTDSYTLRLTSKPDASVTINPLTDGQTSIVSATGPGGSNRLTTQEIGSIDLIEYFRGPVQINGAVITRTDASSGSFLEEG